MTKKERAQRNAEAEAEKMAIRQQPCYRCKAAPAGCAVRELSFLVTLAPWDAAICESCAASIRQADLASKGISLAADSPQHGTKLGPDPEYLRMLRIQNIPDKEARGRWPGREDI